MSPRTAPPVWLEQVSEDRVRVTVGDRSFEIDASCPHRGGRLVHAHVGARGLRVVCPMHGSTFDLTTGCRLAGPDAGPLAASETTPGTASGIADRLTDGRPG